MPNPNYRDTITIYNCLKAKDSEDGKEKWYPTVLQGCFFKATSVQTASGQNLVMASSYTARIPQDARYLPYAEWAKRKDRSGYFTVSLNDAVLKGGIVEEITGKSPATVTELIAEHKPEAFRVRTFSDNTGMPRGKHYRVNGV